MSRKLSSPAAQLLRSSRLFSLPPPIPGASTTPGTSSDFTSVSETATQPFPTRQAIATPPSSLHRGDWGLKRPLPLRETTRSSAPTMRVYEVDTINLFTDFESAGDHVRTLEKWQEMNIPLTLSPDTRMSASDKQETAISAFHERFDNTQLTEEARNNGHSKWKSKGPYLAGMSEGEFKSYLETVPRRRKEEFRKHLREYVAKKALGEAAYVAMERASTTPMRRPSVQGTFKVSDGEFEKMVKVLREDTTLSSELSRLIRDFFDLPGVHADTIQPPEKFAADLLKRFGNNTTMKGPPTTHPSAGLSYLRSAAFLQNHPILGPLESREPIEARLLSGRQTAQKVSSQARAGVGGVVADLRVSQSGSIRTDEYQFIRFEEHGGHKVWVSPERAYIDSTGHIKLAVNSAIPEDVRIKQGSLKSKEELEAKPAPRIEELDTRAADLDTNDGSVQEQSRQILGILNGMSSAGGQVDAPRRGAD
ncbi:uncharacterized protein BKCO1_7200012 [Diplodia corticola]|uniref:Uncharacterized protein n=1 Tax=Diplodia corticola TaxID=236234 RepID=A0A1J9QMT5_9PEZI|nr:uncharacterized protein BKCO1_7200012 [Diplodia corticola]OJD29785.1 hypothetical protein BKCO1_7200012 [Diplodia corticola]